MNTGRMVAMTSMLSRCVLSSLTSSSFVVELVVVAPLLALLLMTSLDTVVSAFTSRATLIATTSAGYYHRSGGSAAFLSSSSRNQGELWRREGGGGLFVIRNDAIIPRMTTSSWYTSNNCNYRGINRLHALLALQGSCNDNHDNYNDPIEATLDCDDNDEEEECNNRVDDSDDDDEQYKMKLTEASSPYWSMIQYVRKNILKISHSKHFDNENDNEYASFKRGQQGLLTGIKEQQILSRIIQYGRSYHYNVCSRGLNDDMTILKFDKNLEVERQQRQQQLKNDEEKEVKSKSFVNKKDKILKSKYTRVSGCISNVNIRTKLIPIQPHYDNDSNEKPVNNDNFIMNKKRQHKYKYATNYQVQIDGNSDAQISRGLLAILSLIVSGGNTGDGRAQSCTTAIMTAQNVLQINPNTIAFHLQLQPLLSSQGGRNDGLFNMICTIQDQIQSLLLLTAATATKPMLTDQEQQIIISNEAKSTSKLYKQAVQQPLKNKTRVAMLLSGGVDSSVALSLLKRNYPNYHIVAFYLRIWLEEEDNSDENTTNRFIDTGHNHQKHLYTSSISSSCPWEDDWLTCQKVCTQLQIPLHSLSLQKQYQQHIIQYTIKEAMSGRTPNPDIMCNSHVKFGCFYKYAIEQCHFDYVATGHYARIERDDSVHDDNDRDNVNLLHKHDDDMNDRQRKIVKLHRAPDPIKDQSYFLSTLSQQQLSKVLFPLGNYNKLQVRNMARHEFDLPNCNRPDSQGLCFLGKVKFDKFLQGYLGERPGDIVDASNGEVIGRHRGLWFHTVGQRKGIGKSLKPRKTAQGPWYVVAKDLDRNVILVSNKYDESIFASARSVFYVENLHWISDNAGLAGMQLYEEGKAMTTTIRFAMKLRHGPRIVDGTLQLTHDDNEQHHRWKVELDEKDGGLAPGQFVVFYRVESGECLGSAVISERHWAAFLAENKAILAENKAILAADLWHSKQLA